MTGSKSELGAEPDLQACQILLGIMQPSRMPLRPPPGYPGSPAQPSPLRRTPKSFALCRHYARGSCRAGAVCKVGAALTHALDPCILDTSALWPRQFAHGSEELSAWHGATGKPIPSAAVSPPHPLVDGLLLRILHRAVQVLRKQMETNILADQEARSKGLVRGRKKSASVEHPTQPVRATAYSLHACLATEHRRTKVSNTAHWLPKVSANFCDYQRKQLAPSAEHHSAGLAHWTAPEDPASLAAMHAPHHR
jgi:hypothetical protein